MVKKFFSIGLLTVLSLGGLSTTSEAGHHHRRARHGAGQNCGTVSTSSYTAVDSGCSGCGGGYNDGAAQSYGAGQSYGAMNYGSSQYGNSSPYGNQFMQSGQGFLNANARGNMGGGRIFGR